jgi:hypothetical protein
MPPLQATLTTRFTPEGFATGSVTVGFTARWMFSGRLTFASAGFTGCGLEAQAPLGGELVLLGRAEWGHAGFSGGELGLLFNPGAPGFQAVSIGGAVEFDPLGLTGQEISFFVDLGVFSVETLSAFSSVGFERLTVRTDGRTEGFGVHGCVTLVPGGAPSVEVGGDALFGSTSLGATALFEGLELREAQGELSWTFAEGTVLAGSILARPAGVVQSVVELSLAGDWYRFTAELWFISAGLHEANATLTMMITDWAIASASVVVKEAALAEAALGTEIGLGDIRLSTRGVCDATGFREFRLRIEVPFTFETLG